MSIELFKVGDKVYCEPGFEGDPGGYGTIVHIEGDNSSWNALGYIYAIEFDSPYFNRHTCGGLASKELGFYYQHNPKYIQLAEENKSQGKYAPIIRKMKQLDEKFKNRKNPTLDIFRSTPTTYIQTGVTIILDEVTSHEF